ncbi:AfsR/SARP family transcriptional regulator [Saccharothrix sp. Mg75]|uniref:AfsR/SARP family transcriptional regulator n=1 Tax=Saccharothrix sp. Mg75 TaxID=3445357 RepID=UPI003EEA5A21
MGATRAGSAMPGRRTGGASTGTVRFEVLGATRVVHAGKVVQVPALRQRTLLAALVLDANRLVSSERLIDVLWGESPPATARAQIHICVSRLRRLLAGADAAHLLVSEPGGYAITVSPDQVDVRLFVDLTVQAGHLAESNLLDEAVAVQRRALRLWRGAALDDVPTPALATRATRLNEERLDAWERCADWELRLGLHRRLVGELMERVIDHPLRERSRVQLMLALYRSGRQAEALEVFHRGRRELVDEFGLEPSAELRRVAAQILTDDSALRWTA